MTENELTYMVFSQNSWLAVMLSPEAAPEHILQDRGPAAGPEQMARDLSRLRGSRDVLARIRLRAVTYSSPSPSLLSELVREELREYFRAVSALTKSNGV